MKILVSFLSIVFLVLTSHGCSCDCGKEMKKTEVPPKVLQQSENFIISKTGKEFYKSYIKLDPYNTMKKDENYFMVFSFSMDDKDYINETISFFVNPKGQVLKEKGVTGIPNCLSIPSQCEFNLTEKEAIKIAEEKNLVEGIRDWRVDFRWNSEMERYVWHILSITEEIGKDDFYKAKGEEMIIDPGNGSVLKTGKWRIN